MDNYYRTIVRSISDDGARRQQEALASFGKVMTRLRGPKAAN